MLPAHQTRKIRHSLCFYESPSSTNSAELHRGHPESPLQVSGCGTGRGAFGLKPRLATRGKPSSRGPGASAPALPSPAPHPLPCIPGTPPPHTHTHTHGLPQGSPASASTTGLLGAGAPSRDTRGLTPVPAQAPPPQRPARALELFLCTYTLACAPAAVVPRGGLQRTGLLDPSLLEAFHSRAGTRRPWDARTAGPGPSPSLWAPKEKTDRPPEAPALPGGATALLTGSGSPPSPSCCLGGVP